MLFFSYERLPKGEVPKGILSVSPDLVVEVKSLSNLWGEMFTKIEDSLSTGVRVVVI